MFNKIILRSPVICALFDEVLWLALRFFTKSAQNMVMTTLANEE